MKYFTLIIISITVLLATSCDKGDCTNSVKAELKDLTGLDGCGFVLELDNGDKLEPRNLNDFNIDIVDGKKVWVNYTVISSPSFCMVGEVVEIDCIAER
ncbi:MAG: hypothetical protein QNK23_17630 [Crocinitomicaceae bacterium]|nr:hypothetical protein [Crocinitomicaceae bacterium]